MILIVGFVIVLPSAFIVSLVGSPMPLIVGFLLMAVVAMVTSLSVGVRRLHDLNKSGFLLLPM